MNIRTVSLFLECPKVDLLSCEYDHIALLKNGLLRIVESPLIDDESIAIIQSLIEQARFLEWKEKIHAEKDYLINQIRQHAVESPINFIDLLCERGPEWAFDLSRKSDTLLMRYIGQIAEPIIHRKTLFLVPETLSYTDKIKSIFKRLSKEAIELIDRNKSPTFSFMPFVGNGSEGAENSLNLYSQLIKQLLIQTSLINNLDRLNDNSSLQTFFEKPGPMLLDGKTGTGKSLTAELLATNNKTSIFYVNISSISKELLESRMRGFIRGSFTGAEKDRAGWFEEANNRILFLDEFQNASLEAQSQLLDLLDPVSNKITVRRIAANQDIHLTVKVILAINEPLKDLIEQNRLRKDLYHRIRSTYNFPNLESILQSSKSTATDICAFLKKILLVYRWKSVSTYAPDNLIASFSTGSLNGLFPIFDDRVLDPIRTKYDWPGNFRELEVFAFDLYWKIDKENDSLSLELIENLLSSKKCVQPDILLPMEDRSLKNKIGAVESAFTNHNFVIRKALQDLKNYKLGSYETLKKFIKENHALFSKNFLEDSKISKILK